jgi:hypothetical protein
LNFNLTHAHSLTSQPASHLLSHFLLAFPITTNSSFFFVCPRSYFGQRNLIYLGTLALVWHATGVYEIFFALTSFVHYCR